MPSPNGKISPQQSLESILLFIKTFLEIENIHLFKFEVNHPQGGKTYYFFSITFYNMNTTIFCLNLKLAQILKVYHDFFPALPPWKQKYRLYTNLSLICCRAYHTCIINVKGKKKNSVQQELRINMHNYICPHSVILQIYVIDIHSLIHNP